jgi:hypothetical protein
LPVLNTEMSIFVLDICGLYNELIENLKNIVFFVLCYFNTYITDIIFSLALGYLSEQSLQ